MAEINYADRPLVFHESRTFRKNKSKRFLANEIEVCECDANLFNRVDQVCKKWSSSVVDDGSLPTRTSFEINMAPSNGDKYVEQVIELCASLKEARASVDRNAGCHLHIDTRDFAPNNIVSLADLYSRLEPALFELVPPSRRNNDYCESCSEDYKEGLKLARQMGDPNDIEDLMAYTIYKEPKDILKYEKGTHSSMYSSRYRALNLHSHMYRQTVECRLFPGTTNPTKIINWGRLWTAIVDRAKNIDRHDDLPSDSFEALLTVSPNAENRRWCKYRRELFK